MNISDIGMLRSKQLIKQGRDTLAQLDNDLTSQRSVSKSLGVVPDPPGLTNVFDKLHIDTVRQLPADILHQDARVSYKSPYMECVAQHVELLHRHMQRTVS